MSAAWRPEDAAVRVGASGQSYLIISDEMMSMRFLSAPKFVVTTLVAGGGFLWVARPNREPVQATRMNEDNFGEPMTIAPGERLLDAFLRQA